MTTVTIATITDPVDASNVTTATATGTTDLDTNTVSVSVVDFDGTTITASAVVTPVTAAWTATLNLTSLDDGLLTWKATATAVASTQAFAATSGQKQVSSDYITATEYRAYINDPSTTLESSRIAAAITSASRAVDAFCDRYFYQITDTIYLWPTFGYGYNAYVVCMDRDLASTTGISVAIDDGSNTFPISWVLNTNYVVEPVNRNVGGIRNVPFTDLRAVNGSYWPVLLTMPWQQAVHPPIRVTGSFGWPAVPDAVKQATKILAAYYYKLGDAPLGATMGEYGVLRAHADNPDACALLRPYAVNGAIAVG